MIRQVLVAAEEFTHERMVDLVLAETFTIGLLYSTGVAGAEDGLHAGRGLCDNGSRAHGRHGDQRRIAQSVLANPVLHLLRQTLDELALRQTLPVEQWEGALLLRHVDGRFVGVVADRLHDLLDGVECFVGVVFHTHLEERIGETGNPQADTTIRGDGLLDLVGGVVGHVVVDHIIEEPRRNSG